MKLMLAKDKQNMFNNTDMTQLTEHWHSALSLEDIQTLKKRKTWIKVRLFVSFVEQRLSLPEHEANTHPERRFNETCAGSEELSCGR